MSFGCAECGRSVPRSATKGSCFWCSGSFNVSFCPGSVSGACSGASAWRRRRPWRPRLAKPPLPASARPAPKRVPAKQPCWLRYAEPRAGGCLSDPQVAIKALASGETYWTVADDEARHRKIVAETEASPAAGLPQLTVRDTPWVDADFAADPLMCASAVASRGFS